MCISPPTVLSQGVSAERRQTSQKAGDLVELTVAPAFFADLGWEYRRSSDNDNRYRHFDYIVQRNTVQYKVEVKAKKNCRNDKYKDLPLVLLEYTGITGHPGWLRGEAHVILQMIDDDSLIAYHRLDALKAYKAPPQEVERYGCYNPPLQKWFGRSGKSRAGLENKDIIRWEPLQAFARDVGFVRYCKVNGTWGKA